MAAGRRYIPPSGKQNSRSCRASVRASVRMSVRVGCRFGSVEWRFGSGGFVPDQLLQVSGFGRFIGGQEHVLSRTRSPTRKKSAVGA